MPQPTLKLGILTPDDVFVCTDIREGYEIQRRQPLEVRAAPRGVWFVMRGCWRCSPAAGYCQRHDPARWPSFNPIRRRTQKIPALSGVDSSTAGML